ncbi:MAG: hypothetical protein HC898_01110 [Phycisphaerales bacterium]|nr:hypothetical protein [Phycisphaerales bacterium]
MAADYRRLIEGVIQWVMQETNAILMLVPHVRPEDPAKYRENLSIGGHDWPDSLACGLVHDQWYAGHPQRVCWIDRPLGVCETKALLGAL